MKSERHRQFEQNQVLADLVDDSIEADGDLGTSIAGLTLHRRSSATSPIASMPGVGLGLTLQGRKRVTLGTEVFDCGPGQSLLTSLELPVVSYVTDASAAQRYLGLCLSLDIGMVAHCAALMQEALPIRKPLAPAMALATLDGGLLDAITRLMHLLQDPQLSPFLAPLIQQEVIIRLLHSEYGAAIRELAIAGSPGRQITHVLAWMKKHYSKAMSMDELAARAHMSPSTFRQHFRRVAGTSPLQYLKHLRLQNARQLLLFGKLDAASAAARVGYQSASQFSREYARLFGKPPLRDVRQMRGAA